MPSDRGKQTKVVLRDNLSQFLLYGHGWGLIDLPQQRGKETAKVKSRLAMRLARSERVRIDEQGQRQSMIVRIAFREISMAIASLYLPFDALVQLDINDRQHGVYRYYSISASVNEQ